MITGTGNSPICTWLFSIKAGRYEVINNKGCCTRAIDRTLYRMVMNIKCRSP
jgi:hypothetical protein